MLKSFNYFINEVLTLKKTDGSHYLDRVNLRLSQLEISGFINNRGEQVDANNSDIIKAQSFFREVLSHLADPNKSKIFSETDIQPGIIGIIRLGNPKIKLANGEEVLPVFKVYERTDSATGQKIFRTGTCFWIFTIGSQVSTIKLYNVCGNSESEKSFLINKSIEHMLKERSAELAKISRVFSVSLESKEDLEKRHTIILNPSGISKILLDLTIDTQSQIQSEISLSTVNKKEQVYLIPNTDSSFNLEMVPKQMNVTPEKVWLLEKNEKFNTWGALPILQSKQVKGLTGNEIKIKVGKKWLHWLDTPIFNTPLQIDRTLKKGDTVSLAKEIGQGKWLVNTGTITDIATDSRSSEYPYVKTDGWDSSIIIDQDKAEKIFIDYRQITESTILNFSQWRFINFQ